MNDRDHGIRRLFLVLIWASFAIPSPAVAEYDSEILLFPFAEGSYLDGLSPASGLDDTDHDFGIDFFGAIENGNFVFLGEALVSRNEQEIERLQVGLRFGESKTWVGRFHNPLGYWNTQFHHGHYLQTSISRPAIVDYEDDGGILPMHLAGLLVEGVHQRGEQGLGYAFAVALGPELGEHLEAVDVLKPGSGSHGPSVTLNVFRQPAAYGPDQYGLFANYTEIDASLRGWEEIRQTIAGGYWNWEPDAWRVLGSAYYVRNRLQQGAARVSDEFQAAYVQAERSVSDELAFFGRVEKTFADDDDAYLELFPDHARERLVAGVRFFLLQQHALKLEISSNRGRDSRYRQITLQWAAMF